MMESFHLELRFLCENKIQTDLAGNLTYPTLGITVAQQFRILT